MRAHHSFDSAYEPPGSHPALDDLRHRLAELDAKQLVDLLLHLASGGEGLYERIETLALSPTEGSRAQAALLDRLERLTDVDDYYTDREARDYADQLDRWIDDVAHAFLPNDPRAACDLLEQFIRADQEIIESVDDSDGDAGSTFRRACELWHRAAGLDPGDEDWVSRVYSLYGGNAYGLRDSLLDHAGPHLPEFELRRLVGLFEEQATRIAEDDDRYARGAALAAIGQIAGTLCDASLYEDTVRMRSPEPNSLQAISIARCYLEFGPAEKAIEWLEKHRGEERFDRERLELLAEAYDRLGDRDRLIAMRREISEKSLSREALDDLFAVLPRSEHVATRQSAIDRARSATDTIAAARLLLHLGESGQAAEAIVRGREEFESTFFGDLLELARELRKAGESLAEIVCYRVLIAQILDRGRSKAYHHAVDYVRHLEAMDRSFSDYAALDTNARFMDELRAAHGRKYSFWQQLDAR
jgi:hypothetical protein